MLAYNKRIYVIEHPFLKILVTGGAGFIGSAMIRFLIKHTNAYVLNVDNLSYASQLNALQSVEAHPRYQFLKADIADFQAITHAINTFQPDNIMHLAAETHVDRSISGPEAFIQSNIVGTFSLLEAARNFYQALPANKQLKFRFHHISTDEVFGDLPHPDESHESKLSKFTEQTPYSPSSPYSASKASSDHLVRAWHRTYGLPIVMTNCSNNYGPFQYPEKLIPKSILNALMGKQIPVYGEGRQIRDWLFVDDHVAALYLVLTQGQIGETYNIGGNNELTNIDVVHMICDLLDALAPKPQSYRGLITHVKDRAGHDKRYAIDTSKIHRELNWTPKTEFSGGLTATVNWYLSQFQKNHLQGLAK